MPWQSRGGRAIKKNGPKVPGLARTGWFVQATVQSGVDLILHLLYRAERRRYAGETMLVGIHHQFQSVGDLKLVEDRSQMMAYGRFRNEQPFADLFVSQPLANQHDHLDLPRREGRNLERLRVRGLARVATQNAGHDGGQQRSAEP